MRDEMIIKGDWESFLNLKGEKLLFVKRRHGFVLFSPIFLTISLSVIFTALSLLVFRYLIPSFPLFLISTLLILTGAMSIVAYSIVYWYFHLYVLTNRKILEVWYTPLFSHIVNDIFLDKVNCTEIDLDSHGIFHELIDMGDITITFDRPTHQEEFVLRDIKDCDALSKFLVSNIMDQDKVGRNEETIWLKGRAGMIPKPAL